MAPPVRAASPPLVPSWAPSEAQYQAYRRQQLAEEDRRRREDRLQAEVAHRREEQQRQREVAERERERERRREEEARRQAHRDEEVEYARRVRLEEQIRAERRERERARSPPRTHTRRPYSADVHQAHPSLRHRDRDADAYRLHVRDSWPTRERYEAPPLRPRGILVRPGQGPLRRREEHVHWDDEEDQYYLGRR